jgi:hypothetical protein
MTKHVKSRRDRIRHGVLMIALSLVVIYWMQVGMNHGRC